MKYVKMLGLLALAATALFAFAASASATTLTSPKGTTYTGSIKAASEGHAITHDTSGLGITLECNVSVESTVVSHGSSVTVKSNVSSLTWTNCTNNWSTTTLKTGSFETHPITGTDNDTTTWSGAEWTAKQSTTGLHCIYSTANTDIGTLTSSTVTGGNATLDIAATITRTGGSSGFFCGTAVQWTGSFKVSTPSTLYVDA
ncbi:MAG TPA: hypothetical protein VKB23_05700 [Solirubrobacterales bacterium]|nr:hypothetical protein [Solirubrobacterales bacterium]